MRRHALGLSMLSLVTLVLFALPQSEATQGTVSRTGTWQLNLTKSRFDPGPGPQRQTRVDQLTTAGLDATVTGIAGNGTPINYRYTPAFDGKEVSIVGTGVPSGADAIAIRRIDNSTIESTLKKAGAVVLTRVEVVSADGRVLTITSQGLDVSGKAASNVTVYDRQ